MDDMDVNHHQFHDAFNRFHFARFSSQKMPLEDTITDYRGQGQPVANHQTLALWGLRRVFVQS